MTFKKSISLILIGSQISLAQASLAAIQSPEFNLVENVIALQGQKLTDTAMQDQVSTMMSHYLMTAPLDGQQERMQRALVDLGVYTETQASEFEVNAEATAAKVAATNPASPEEASQAMSAEISLLASLHPVGAQFATCNTGLGLTSVGAVAALVGVCLRWDNPSCTTVTSTGINLTTGQPVLINGPATCTQANDFPYSNVGDKLMIYGGIAAGVGALIMAFSHDECGW